MPEIFNLKVGFSKIDPFTPNEEALTNKMYSAATIALKFLKDEGVVNPVGFSFKKEGELYLIPLPFTDLEKKLLVAKAITQILREKIKPDFFMYVSEIWFAFDLGEEGENEKGEFIPPSERFDREEGILIQGFSYAFNKSLSIKFKRDQEDKPIIPDISSAEILSYGQDNLFGGIFS